MTKRRKNPVYSSGKRFRYRVVDGQKVPPKGQTLTKRDRKQFSKTVAYMERVKALRPFFGDTFKASEGFNLHDVENWTPAQKRKVTRYYRELAPIIASGNFQVKRYRKPERLNAAIEASLQEQKLPGQKVAVFSVDPGERVELEWKAREREPIVKRGGIEEQKLMFDKNAFLADWKSEVERVLSQTDANVFKVVTGRFRTTETFTREAVIDRILAFMVSYPEEMKQSKGFEDKWYGEWLNGIIAYKGVSLSKMRTLSKAHKKEVDARRRERLSTKARQFRRLTQGEMSKMRKGRRK